MRFSLHVSCWEHCWWSHFWECHWIAIVDVLRLCQEFNWIKFMFLLLLLFLDVFLRGDNVRVQRVVSLVLHNLLLVRWVHVSGLVAIIRVEWWIRSLIRLSLQFCLLLDLLLIFLLLLLVSLLLLVLGWLFVHGPGAFLGLLILEVGLCVSNVFVEWQANWVLDDLFFFVLGPGPWLSAPARGGANWI